MKFIKNRTILLILSISFIFIIIRLFFLDQLFLLHDERDIVLTSESIAKTGRDLFGNFLPITFKGISPQVPLFTYYFLAAWYKLFPPNNIILARLPFILITSFIVCLIYLIINKLTKNKNLSILTSIFLCFSPWYYHMTRLALEANIALVMILTAIYCFISNKRLFALCFLTIAFYCYQGARLAILPLILALECYHIYKNRFNKKKLYRGLFISLLWMFLVLTSLKFTDFSINSSRINEIIFFDIEKITQEVNNLRLYSNAPFTVKQLFDNKLTVSINYVINNLFKAFDISYLFIKGDDSAINGNAASGQFFSVLIIPYLFGLLTLLSVFSVESFLIFSIGLISLIPALLNSHGTSFSFRSSLSAIIYAYIIANGTQKMIYFIKNKCLFRKIIVSLLFILLLFNTCSFGYNYFIKRQISVSELFNEHERQLNNYLITRSDSIIVYSPQPQDAYLSYVFSQPNRNYQTIQNEINNKTYQYKQHKFVLCSHLTDYQNLTNAVITERCLDPKKYEYFQNGNLKVVNKIPFHDISQKTAYFVTR